MQSVLMDKVDCIQEQVSDISREMRTLRKIQREMLGISQFNRNEEFFHRLYSQLDLLAQNCNSKSKVQAIFLHLWLYFSLLTATFMEVDVFPVAAF